MNTALLNGVETADALVASRALHYGDGVFRTLLVHDGRPLDLDRHLDQLAVDCGRLHLVPPDRGALAADTWRLAQGQARAVVKMIAMRRAGARGYRGDTDASDRLVTRAPAPAYPRACWEQGVRVILSPLALAAQPLLAGAKHLNRLEQVLASRDWPAGVDEALMCDAEGRPIGGTRSNLFWITVEGLFTPALDRCGVEGVTRRKIIELASKLEVNVQIVSAPLAALMQATEVLVCNAVIGLWPVRELAGRALEAPGPLTRRLLAALDHPGQA